MKFASLILVTIRGITLISITGLLLWFVRNNYIYGNPHVPFGVFVFFACAVFGGVFGFASKACLNEAQRLKDGG
jgi:hypothetical protein